MNRTMIYMTFLWINLWRMIGNERGNFMGAGGDGGGGDGGDGGSGNPGDGGDGGDGGIQYQYPDGFDEKLKGNEALKPFAKEDGSFDYSKIMKSYVHTKGMVGKDKMPLPDETWTDDQWNDLFTKLGRPEDVSEYGLKNNLPEGLEENKEFFEKFQKTAHEAGLLPKQAQHLADFMNNFIGDSVKQTSEMAQAEYEKESNELKKEWGDAFDAKATKAFSALQQFADDSTIQNLKQKGFLDDPSMTRLFDKVAEAMSGDTLVNPKGNTFGMTPDDAREEINKYYQKDHPFMIKGHPERPFYVKKMQELQRIKLKGK